mgnify:CR=1 FL=1
MKFKFRKYNSRFSRKLFEFVESLSEDTRKRLSLSGIDPKTIHSNLKKCLPDEQLILLLTDKKIIACGKLTRIDDETWEVSGLVVADSYQRQGFGKRMMKYLMSLILLNNGKEIILEVKKDNTEALKFYEKLGFKKEKELIYTYLLRKKLQ